MSRVLRPLKKLRPTWRPSVLTTATRSRLSQGHPSAILWSPWRPAFSSTPTRLSLPEGKDVIMHRVEIRRRKRARNTIVTAFVLLTGLYVYYDSTIPEEEDDEEFDEKSVESRWMIPLPLTMRKVVPPPYKVSDPEWKEFIRISKDQELKKRMQRMVVAKVRAVAELQVRFLNPRDRVKDVVKAWLDIDYPYSPPPEYWRYCIMSSPDTISLVSQRVDPAKVALTRRTLQPYPAFRSTLSFGGALFKQHMADAAAYLGFAGKTSPPASPAMAVNAPDGDSGSSNSNVLPVTPSTFLEKPSQSVRQQATRRPEDVQNPGALAKSPERQAKNKADNGDKKYQDSEHFWESSLRAVLQEPFKDFRKKFSQLWGQPVVLPPRGSVYLSGLVSVETERMRLTYDVWAFYDPKTRQLDLPSLHIKLRRVQHKFYKARGR